MSAAARRFAAAYPKVRRDSHAYERLGRTIADPYQYLEEPDSAETKEFVDAQNTHFNSYIEQYPQRQKLADTIEKTMNYPRFSAPARRHGKAYFWHNTGLQNQSVLKRVQDGAIANPAAADEAEVFLDPNALSEDGTSALGSASWSESETHYAYAVAEKGSDWHKIFVRVGDSAKDTEEHVDWVKYSGIAWFGDAGFFYTRYPASDSAAKDKGAETESAENPSVCYHKLGTSQDADIEVFRTPENPKYSLSMDVSDDKKYLIAYISDGCDPKNLIHIAEAPANFAEEPSKPTFKPIIDEWVGEYSALANNGADFLFTTTKDAPNKKIVNVNIDTKVQTDVVAERESVLAFSAVVKEKLLVVYLEDVKHVFYYRPWAGGVDVKLESIDIPIGSISSLSCRYDKDFVSFKMTSFLFAGRSFYFDINDPSKITVWKDDKVEGFNPDDFEAKQVFVPSTDGVKIPMFILHKKGINLDGQNPTLLYGYGGFNIPLSPSFSPNRVVFLNKLGGVLAIANIRGGGEYGEKWHDGGRKKNKENCFIDFVNCGQYLHSEKYCNPKKLAIMGGSNGGLLVAACANRAPDQFKAVIAQVGVLDMYKFHKFTIGHAWRSDYGDPDVEEDFQVVEKYSPLHNIKEGVEYPAILALTGDHDDRVVPLHTHKYVATLQHSNPSVGGPFLARIEVAAGHGAGKPTSKIIKEATDTYAFIANELDATWTD